MLDDCVLRVSAVRRFRTVGIAAQVLVAMLALAPLAAAQCTKDTDCKYGRVCEYGACVAPDDAGAAPPEASAPSRGKSGQKQAACLQKCEHERTKCLGKVRSGGDCVGDRRAACLKACRANYPTETCASTICNADNPRNAWRAECGGDPVGDCTAANDRCRRGCQ